MDKDGIMHALAQLGRYVVEQAAAEEEAVRVALYFEAAAIVF